MSLEQQVSSLVTAANKLTGVVNEKVAGIDKRVEQAEAEFAEFTSTADSRYMTRVGTYVHVGGDSDKFYPVYIPAAHAGITELQINRSVHFDREWAGALTARVLLQNNAWGGYPSFLYLDALGIQYHPTLTPKNILSDGFIADYRNGAGFIAGAIFWLRGNHRYLVSSTLRAFKSVISHPERVTTSVFDHSSIRIFESGYDVNYGGYHGTSEVKTERNLTTIPSLEYIRGV